MKKKALFLAAGLAVISAGMASESIHASAAVIRLKTDSEKALGQAIVDHASKYVSGSTTPTNINIATNYMDSTDSALLYDGPMISRLDFDCENGNPIEGITDFSILSDSDSFFRQLTEIKLCGESVSSPIDYGTLPTTLTSLTVGDANKSYNVAPVSDSTLPKNISTLTNLVSVRLSGVQVGSLDGFKNMAHLNELVINNGGLKNINALANFASVPNVINFKGNYIENIGVLMTVCVNASHCSTSDWDAAYGNQRYLNAISENVTYIPMVGDTAIIPEYFTALYSKFYGYDDAYKDYVTTEGLKLNDDYDTITLTGGNEGTLTIKDPGLTTRNKYTLIFEKKMDDDSEESGTTDGSDNPDTGDSFNLGWAMGIAAAILATGSFVVRSRR